MERPSWTRCASCLSDRTRYTFSAVSLGSARQLPDFTAALSVADCLSSAASSRAVVVSFRLTTAQLKAVVGRANPVDRNSRSWTSGVVARRRVNALLRRLQGQSLIAKFHYTDMDPHAPNGISPQKSP